ncbi:MAG: OmpA family protein [Treponema sp.]|nr:OmpA family protein [Treponema sp.]
MKGKKIGIAFILCMTMGLLFAERAPEYISPNNDGIKDTLDIPLKIKEKRYIKEWALSIYTEKGNVIRTVGNKRKDEEKLTISSFFKNLFKPKTGVEIPEVVSWNGILGEEAAAIGLTPGTVAPDGLYYYIFTATDDNDNRGTSAKYYVIVDTTPPQISLDKLNEDEKSFGVGEKTSIKIKQTGSEEPEWSAAIIYNADGSKVRTYKWLNTTPSPIVEWDGTNDDGIIVPDGVYTYEIYATDKAGNKSEKAQIQNIIFSAEKPVTSIAISGPKYFSPNGDGKLDTIKFDVSIPETKSKVNSIKEWSITIENADKKTVFEKKGSGNAISELNFDGKGSDGKTLPEGEYRAMVSASYKNGYVPPKAYSPVFVLDVSAPSAQVAVSDLVFNASRSLKLTQQQTSKDPSYSSEKEWNARIIDENKNTIRSYSYGSILPPEISWNGSDENGELAKDGTYIYELTGKDLAGNKSTATSLPFTLDTSKTELLLIPSPEYISPNNDGIQDKTTLNLTARATSGIDSYTITISDKDGKEVRAISGQSTLPPSIAWDGKSDDGSVCADGTYSIVFKTVANSGTEAESEPKTVTIDTVAPKVEISVPYYIFSPDGQSTTASTRQGLPVSSKECSTEDKWTMEITDSKNTAVRTIVWQNENGIKITPFIWDGTDDSGNLVPNAKYSLRVFSTDKAGNSGQAKLPENITVDTRETKAYITLAYEAICPNGDGVKDAQTFNIITTLNEGITEWNLDVLDENEKSIKNWNGKNGQTIPTSITWDGKTDGSTNPAEGVFAGRLKVSYDKGNIVETYSLPFVSSITAPVLSVTSSANPANGKYFSPDNDGYEDELKMQLNAKTNAKIKSWSLVVKDSRNGTEFWKASGKSMAAGKEAGTYTANITWDGRGNNGQVVVSAEDYPYEYTVTDELGLSSTYTGIIPVDVLVLLENGVLKMQVPSIVFRGDAADFILSGETGPDGKIIEKSSLTAEQKANNIRILNRVAQILNKFSSYKVTVVGHANPTNKFAGKEEDNPEENQDGSWGRGLKALSLERAQFVRQWLITEGHISASRLSAKGKGGLETIVDPYSLENRWKNRRVEFILEK